MSTVHKNLIKMYDCFESSPMYQKPPLLRMICHPSLVIAGSIGWFVWYLLIQLITWVFQSYMTGKEHEFYVMVFMCVVAYRQYLVGMVNLMTDKDIRLKIAESSTSAFGYAHLVMYYIIHRFGTSPRIWMPFVSLAGMCVFSYFNQEYIDLSFKVSCVISYILMVMSVCRIEVQVK